MPTFNPAVRSNKEYNAIYIRITHNHKADYIKTDMLVHKTSIKKGEITDYTILANCAIKIKSYVSKINNLNIGNWTIQELKKFLINDTDNISFSDFGYNYANKMENDGRKKPAENYRTALRSLEKHFGREINFSDITVQHLRKWIDSLRKTARAKQMYPTMIKKLFDEGCLEYNDYDRDIIRIKNQPFKPVKIPKNEMPRKRYAEIDVIRAILKEPAQTEREQLAHDVAVMSLCLAGINAIDLYNLEKQMYQNGKLCYNRSKEKNIRGDKAYFEISVPKIINPVVEKHKGKKCLFNFRERYSDPDNFSRAINTGLKSLCSRAGVQKITMYWLRHTWATVAQNNCGATDEQVAFCLNHASAHRVTQFYIEKDFSPVDVMNEKVINFIWETNK